MIRAEFYHSDGLFKGFSISGHSGYAEAGSDIVCASVSSAVQLIINLIDAMGCKPYVNVEENLIECRVKTENVSVMLEVFKSHLESILEEFPETINITISEV